MAVYLVKGPNGKKVLVETRTKSGAINHVSKKEYEAVSLNTSELVKHIKAGMEVETIGDDVEAEEPTTLGDIVNKKMKEDKKSVNAAPKKVAA